MTAKAAIDTDIYYHHMYVIVTGMMRFGWSKEDALKALGLPAPESVDPERRIHMRHYFELCHKANEVNNDPLFCFKAGARCHPADYGVIGKLAMFSDTLWEAQQLFLRYQGLINSAISTSAVNDGDSVIYPLSTGDIDPELIRPLSEFRAAATVSIARFITGDIHHDIFEEIHFQHKGIVPAEDYQSILGVPVKLGQVRTSYRARMSAADIPLIFSDPDIHKLVLKEAYGSSVKLSGKESLRDRIVLYIQPKLALGMPTLEQCAQHFNFSPSTLKRRLQEENSSYQNVCDDLRKDVCSHLLLTTSKPIADIALLAGFSQPSTFVKSFKRWTDKTPQQFRQS